MLGLAAAESACKSPFRPLPGAIRGASVDVGHRLRRAQELGEPSRTERFPVVIVGSGPSGLAAAWRLAREGEGRYVVLDLEDASGGTSRFGDDGVVSYPWGAHYVPVPRADNVALVTLLREMGAITGVDEHGEPVPAETMVVRDPEERLFDGGQWHEGLYLRDGATAGDLEQLGRFHAEISRLAGLRDGRGRRAFSIPMERGSDDPDITALDRQSFAQWLDQRGLVSARLRWLCDYACRDDYGLLASQASAWAGLFYFASRVASPGAEAAPLLSWTNGNGRLVEHLRGASPGKIRLGQLVVDIAPFDDRVELLVLDAARNEVVRYVADRVVLAAPRMVAAHILRPYRDARPAFLREFKYGAWMVANVHLTAHPPDGPGAPLAWDNVLRDSPSLGYVVATHQAHIDEGPTVLTYYYPYTDSDPDVGRRRLLAAGHGELSDLVLADLSPAHRGLRALVSRIDVFRWGHAMTQPRVGFVFGGARAQAAAPVGRVHMAHSDLSGLALFEEALHHGLRAAEEVLVGLDPSRERALVRLG
jgi:protoporphyrinogen oxidase